MKIYKEVRIDIGTGKVTHEKSFEYEGPVALCKGGGSTTTVDPEYNAGLLALARENQAWSNELMNRYFYADGGDPNAVATGYYDAEGKFQAINNKDGKALDGTKINSEMAYNPETGRYHNQDGITYSPENGGMWFDPAGNQISFVKTTAGEAYGDSLSTHTSGADYEQNAIDAQQSLLAGETEASAKATALAGAKSDAEMGLLPLQTDASASGYKLTTATNEMNLANVPAQGEADLSGYKLTTAQNNRDMSFIPGQTAVGQAFYDSALKGVDPNKKADQAQVDATMAFTNAGRDMRQQAALSGVNPNSGRFAGALANNSLDMAKAIGGARTQARDAAETQNFQRLSTAMGGIK